jgi:23S rRNA pseudouridine1911/1915/1917 synthase
LKPRFIELATGERIPILYEDRSVMAIDKPRGWMLVPFSWQQTARNLQAALTSSIAAGDFWARSRALKYLRFVHRLDADTTGILLLAKSPGALSTFGDLFEGRKMEKIYLAVVHGKPAKTDWTCRAKIGPHPQERGKMKAGLREGKDAETHFHLLQTRERTSLVEARPVTGRTHQIRLHLAETRHPVVGDRLYGPATGSDAQELALRAVRLAYVDPFTRRPVHIRAPVDAFVSEYGFERDEYGKEKS